MPSYRIHLDRQYVGTVVIEDEQTTSPQAEARRQGLIKREDVYRALAYKVEDDAPDT